MWLKEEGPKRWHVSAINMLLPLKWFSTKALQNWKISVKALTKRLWKLTIITKRLIAIIIVSFVNVND